MSFFDKTSRLCFRHKSIRPQSDVERNGWLPWKHNTYIYIYIDLTFHSSSSSSSSRSRSRTRSSSSRSRSRTRSSSSSSSSSRSSSSSSSSSSRSSSSRSSSSSSSILICVSLIGWWLCEMISNVYAYFSILSIYFTTWPWELKNLWYHWTNKSIRTAAYIGHC